MPRFTPLGPTPVGRDEPLPLDALDFDEALIAARFEWAVRQGHAGYVWPELPIHIWRACLMEIERVTARLLTGGRATLDLPAGASARALGIAAFSSGMGPLLGYWVEAGSLGAAGEVARLLELHLRHGRLRAARMEAVLHDFAQTAAELSIPVTVIKGAFTATAYFPEPGTRPAADIDVVVPRQAALPLRQRLEQRGYRMLIRHPGWDKYDMTAPGSDDRLRSLELNHADDPLTVEVHTSLSRAFDGVRTIDLGEPAALTQAWRADGMRALRPPAQLAYLALHASQELHHLQLLRLVELVFAIRRDFRSAAAWADLRILLQRCGGLRFVYPAFELVERLVPGTVHADVRRETTRAAHGRLLRVVEPLRPATAQRIDRLTLDDRLIWADGAWQTLRRLSYLVWPRRARHSRRPLRSVYRERLYRLLRGRFGLR